MKYLSDVECYPELNSFSVEWEFEEGGRFWESFTTEEDMTAAISKQQTELIESEVDELIAKNPSSYIRIRPLYRPNWKRKDKVMMGIKIDEHNANVINKNKETNQGCKSRGLKVNPGAATFTLGEILMKK